MVGGGVLERRGGQYRDATLRPWARACAIFMIAGGIALTAQAAFIKTLPDKVLENVALAGLKAARDIELAEANVQLEPGSTIDPLALMHLPNDAQLEAKVAANRADFIAAARSEFALSVWAKGIGGFLILLCGWLVLRRRLDEASWVAWALSLAGVVFAWGFFAGLSYARAAAKYYENMPLKLVEFVAIANIPLVVLISFAFAWVPRKLWIRTAPETVDVSPSPTT